MWTGHNRHSQTLWTGHNRDTRTLQDGVSSIFYIRHGHAWQCYLECRIISDRGRYNGTLMGTWYVLYSNHDDVIKWKHFPRYWSFVWGIRRSPVNSLHKCKWHGALLFSLICAWINGWVNNRESGDLGRHHAHYDVTVMILRRNKI